MRTTLKKQEQANEALFIAGGGGSSQTGKTQKIVKYTTIQTS